MLPQTFIILGLFDRAIGCRVSIERSVNHVVLEPLGYDSSL
jgi:hypothetical protein